jgi:glycosyltransferase involved in cell wall biosynthesis
LRILAITAGAGPMFCGSCLRDNALATELTARGHDVTLLPVYTPTRTDEPNVSEKEVLFGGISVYLQQHVALFRHTPAVVDRLWDNAAVIRAFAGRGVSVDPASLGAMTVSMLEGERGHQKKELRKLETWLRGQAPFDVIVLPTSLLSGMAPTLARASGRPVLCTMQGEDLFLDGLGAEHREASRRLIADNAAHVTRFIAVSDYYAGFMAGYLGIPRERIDTVPLGVHVDAAGTAVPEPPADRPFTVGYLARVAPEKGLAVLAEVYRILRRERGLAAARLRAAGYLAPEQRPYLEGVFRGLEDAGLRDEFAYDGTVDLTGKARLLRSIDVFALPSPYREPKGLPVLEAMGAGVPVVVPRHGAFTEMVEKTGGGVLVPPGDPAAFADALLALSKDRERARALGRAGAEGVRRHYLASRMADRALEVYAAAAARAAA